MSDGVMWSSLNSLLSSYASYTRTLWLGSLSLSLYMGVGVGVF